ncbi:unnamed protein product [Blepharisma stoltei]|uniref:Proteinase inhibitor I42 chagasin domain-containing protein n=1 Tax=Blepharisma stoltei TaxID=1481888 RepID=A0AAU9JMI9_9CILI|nr:unnamed protein product [Blepharisma stoltei]
MKFMIIVFLFAISFISGEVYNLDESSEVSISKEGSLQMSISSNPTTGYYWYIDESTLGVVTTDNLDGDYISSQSHLLGAGGSQIFTLYCTDLCVEGENTSVKLEYMRSWEKEPIEIVDVTVYIVS